jgi:predicted GIY-YIG superfamily endonuclease
MHYVYLLQSERFPDQRYVGITSDLKRRLIDQVTRPLQRAALLIRWLEFCPKIEDQGLVTRSLRMST